MQDALNQAVRNKLEMDELCSRLKLKLEGVNELSKMVEKWIYTKLAAH